MSFKKHLAENNHGTLFRFPESIALSIHEAVHTKHGKLWMVVVKYRPSSCYRHSHVITVTRDPDMSI
jgi:hypothetical protein